MPESPRIEELRRRIQLDPASIETYRAEAPVFDILQPPAMAAPQPAGAPIVTAFEPPKADPALERLEAFPHAILCAREVVGGIHVS